MDIIIMIHYTIQNFTYATQFDCRIASIQAIWMILIWFERGESHLLTDTKIVKFGWIDRKLNGNWNDTCDLFKVIKKERRYHVGSGKASCGQCLHERVESEVFLVLVRFQKTM